MYVKYVFGLGYPLLIVSVDKKVEPSDEQVIG